MHKTPVLFLAVALGLGAGPAAAQGTPRPPAAASTPAMPLVQGEVRKVDVAKGLVVLRHGDIPNLAMPPMTMGFDVADPRMLDGLKVGDKVSFQARDGQGKGDRDRAQTRDRTMTAPSARPRRASWTKA